MTQVSIDDIVQMRGTIARLGGAKHVAELAYAVEGTATMVADTATAPAVDDPSLAVAEESAPPDAPVLKHRGGPKKARPSAKRDEKRRRASPLEVEERKRAVLKVMATATPGTRFSKADIEKLGCNVDSRTLTLLTREGKILAEGERRNTRYWVVG